MIPISLPSGKVVFVKTIDQLLNFDFQDAMADDEGFNINDPFFGSSLSSKKDEDKIKSLVALEIIELDEVEYIPEDLDED